MLTCKSLCLPVRARVSVLFVSLCLGACLYMSVHVCCHARLYVHLCICT